MSLKNVLIEIVAYHNKQTTTLQWNHSVKFLIHIEPVCSLNRVKLWDSIDLNVLFTFTFTMLLTSNDQRRYVIAFIVYGKIIMCFVITFFLITLLFKTGESHVSDIRRCMPENDSLRYS